MKIIIKARSKLAIPQDLEDYINAKIFKVTRGLKEPSVCEVALSDTKSVHISCSIAGIKNPVYVETEGEDFFRSVDIAKDKLARALHKAKR